VSEAYALAGQEETKAGRVILVVSSSLATVLLIAAVIYAMGTGARHQAALAAAGCEPGLSPAGLQCTTTQMLDSHYLAVTTAASQQLRTDAAAYTANERHHLAAAEAALAAEVTSEQTFGTSLAAIRFPPTIAAAAKALARANQARATLTAEQARSSSLTRMRSFNRRVELAGATVQAKMNFISKALLANGHR
jgi:hypothetical protein